MLCGMTGGLKFYVFQIICQFVCLIENIIYDEV